MVSIISHLQQCFLLKFYSHCCRIILPLHVWVIRSSSVLDFLMKRYGFLEHSWVNGMEATWMMIPVSEMENSKVSNPCVGLFQWWMTKKNDNSTPHSKWDDFGMTTLMYNLSDLMLSSSTKMIDQGIVISVRFFRHSNIGFRRYFPLFPKRSFLFLASIVS